MELKEEINKYNFIIYIIINKKIYDFIFQNFGLKLSYVYKYIF